MIREVIVGDGALCQPLSLDIEPDVPSILVVYSPFRPSIRRDSFPGFQYDMSVRLLQAGTYLCRVVSQSEQHLVEFATNGRLMHRSEVVMKHTYCVVVTQPTRYGVSIENCEPRTVALYQLTQLTWDKLQLEPMSDWIFRSVPKFLASNSDIMDEYRAENPVHIETFPVSETVQLATLTCRLPSGLYTTRHVVYVLADSWPALATN